jgi:hypothetical protein
MSLLSTLQVKDPFMIMAKGMRKAFNGWPLAYLTNHTSMHTLIVVKNQLQCTIPTSDDSTLV